MKVRKVTNNTAVAIPVKQPVYDPVDMKHFRINPHICRFHILKDRNGAVLFELRQGEMPVMAFLYNNLPPWKFKQKQYAFYKLLFRGDNAIPFNAFPIEEVSTLPERFMWRLGSSLEEDLFWASDMVSICIYPMPGKNTWLSLSLMMGNEIGTFIISGRESDHEDVLSAALELRKRIHMQKQIRVESNYNEKRICWYIPARTQF